MGSHALTYEPYPEVTPQGGPEARESIHADPDMFGAAIGKGLSTLGQGIEHSDSAGFDVATMQARQDDHTHANELHSWQSDQVTNAQEKFLTLRGKDAEMALPAFKQQVADLHRQAREQAGNPYTQQLVDSEGRKLTDIAYAQAARHAAHQRVTWDTTTSTDSATAAGNRASIAAYTTPPDIALNANPSVVLSLGRSDDFARHAAQLKGLDGETEVQRNRGTHVKNIIEQAVKDGSPDGLKRGVDFFNAQKERIDEGSRLAIQSFLSAPLIQSAGREIADDAMGRRSADGAPQQSVAGMPAPFLSAIKQTEGFAPAARWDYKQFSNGYGTRAKFEGEKIDRAEADRRFGAAIENAAKIVDAVNPNLDSGTRAALTSLTYNEGSTWTTAGLGDKIRAGDLTGAKDLFLQYTKAGGVENEGLAARRYRESGWFGKAAPPALAMLPDKGEALSRLQALTHNLPPAVQNAALSHLNKEYAEATSTQALEVYAVKGLMKSDLESTLKTGKGVSDFAADRVALALGPSEADKYREDKAVAFATWNATHDLFQLDDRQIDQRLASMQPTAGAADFSRQQSVFDATQTRVNELRKQRNDDPAATVADDLHVKAAQAMVDPRHPETFLPLSASRLAAQATAGIPEENRSPITQAEALRLTQPLRTMLPGQERQVLSQIAGNMKQLFGNDAETAFSYALRAHKVDAEVAQVAARLMKKLNLGQMPTQEDAQAADTATEIAKANAAVNPGYNPSYSVPGYGMGPSQQEVDAGAAARRSGVNLPARAVIDLRLNPKLAADFDKKYGAGTSAKILENYPVR